MSNNSNPQLKVKISMHAVERYLDRINPCASKEEAEEEITLAFTSGSRQKARTHAGDAVYLSPKMRLVVAEENGYREIITVLEPERTVEDNLPELALSLNEEFLSWERARVKCRDSNGEVEELRRLNAELTRGVERRQKVINSINGKGYTAQRITELRQQNESIKRKFEKQVAHGQRMSNERERLAEDIRILVEYLVSQGRIDEAEIKLITSYPDLYDAVRDVIIITRPRQEIQP